MRPETPGPGARRCRPRPTRDRLLLTRLLTAAALLAAFIGALFLGNTWVLAGMAALIIAFGGYEWGRLGGLGRPLAAGYSAACLGFLGIVFLLPGFPAEELAVVASVFWIVVVPAWLAIGITSNARIAMLFAGPLALAPAAVALIALRPWTVLLVLGLVWIADTAAYLAGSTFGKHKLAPKISPNKTWEGVAGAVVGSLIYAIICAMVEEGLRARVQGAIWVPFLAGALLLCAASIVGDLFESALKRQAGAKDSGRLLPGHGGVLDRIDSALAVLPPALVLVQAMGAR